MPSIGANHHPSQSVEKTCTEPPDATPFAGTTAPDDDFPTGPSGANATDITSKRDITFATSSPAFETGKLMWNSLLPLLPVDTLNLKLGVDQLPVGFSPDHNRISIRPYLIYRRRALDLLSPAQTDDVFSSGNEADRLNRLGENQISVSLYGLVPFSQPTDLGKPETLTLVYDVGVTNGSGRREVRLSRGRKATLPRPGE